MNSSFTRSLFTLLLILALGLGITSEAEARNINVNCNSKSLQTAVNRANPGDTLNVSGTCNERITINVDNITLNGGGDAQGNGSGVIDGTGIPLPGALVRVHGSNVNITGFTVQNSPASGIKVKRSGSALIFSNLIQDNVRHGIIVTSGFARIGAGKTNHDLPGTPGSEGNTIQNNTLNGINVNTGAGANIRYNIISGNDRGIHLRTGGNANIDGNNIINNTRGINLVTNSAVRLSGDNNHGELNEINGSTVGVRCRTGGTLSGTAPDFTGGNTSNTDIGGDCVESIPSFP